MRFEDFFNITNDNAKLKFVCEINPNPTGYLIPHNYKNYNGDIPCESVAISGYPSISYITDYYNSWLAQNSGVLEVQMRQEEYNYEHNVSISNAKNIMGTIGNLGSAISTANIGQAYQTGTDFAINQAMIEMQHQNYGEYVNMMMAQKEKQQLLPNSANLGSSNSTLLGYDYFNKAVLICFSIKREFAEKIDKYFSVYGYATNKIKTPNLNNRTNWNYIKTIGANITGNIPQLDLQRLKDMFDSGVTLWHTTSYYLDYSQNNN